jgi:quercetin dioxygenase-like cupin family protein
MKRSAFGMAIWVVAPFVSAADQGGTTDPSATAQTITRAGTQTSTIGSADYFTGRVRVEPLFPATKDINASAAYVTFEAGARSAWHVHPAGQRLVVVSGVGRTQEWGKPVQEIRPGDVIVCPPGVRHWHGASPTASMTHLAMSGTIEGKSVQWMEKVSDDQYNSLATQKSEEPRGMSPTTPVAQTLTARQRSIPLIAASMATSDMPKLNNALNQGLDSGQTISEAKSSGK